MTSYDEMAISYGIPFGDNAVTFDREMLETLYNLIGGALAKTPDDFERMSWCAAMERKAWEDANGDVPKYRSLKAEYRKASL